MKSNIIVCGDQHGSWSHLNILINKKKPDIILQCGDLGFWPNMHNTRLIDTGKKEWVEGHADSAGRLHIPGYSRRQITAKWDQYGIKNHTTKIYWCDGNHEDHDAIDNIVKSNKLEIMPNVFYQPRASYMKLPDERVVLFMGGADSIDKKWRIQGHDWFPQELISYRDMDNLPECKIDIVISHTCPEECMYFMKDHIKNDYKDPSRSALSYVLEKYKPSLWYFGHFHFEKKFQYKDTVFHMLDMAGPGRSWWVWLP